jgi:cysteine desulfurase / selenocysteine lyase
MYFDHAATSLPRRTECVQAAVEASSWANAGRGTHGRQADSSARVEAARGVLAAMVGFGEICFTSGATAALNQAILGWDPPPACIALGPMVHNAVRRPAYHCAAEVWTLPHDRDGRIDVAATRRAWHEGTALVVVDDASNVTGLRQPVGDLVEVAHERGAAVVVDCAQTAGMVTPLEVGEADAVAFSAHKGLRALPGCGVLAVRASLPLVPRVLGGTGDDALGEAMPAELPRRLEAGTLNLPGIAALGAAAAAARRECWDWRGTASHLREAVVAGGGRLLGRGELPIVSFVVDGMPAFEVEEMLDRVYGITCRAGLHCAPAAHAVLGTLEGGTVRVSAGASTTCDELQQLEAALGRITAARASHA